MNLLQEGKIPLSLAILMGMIGWLVTNLFSEVKDATYINYAEKKVSTVQVKQKKYIKRELIVTNGSLQNSASNLVITISCVIGENNPSDCFQNIGSVENKNYGSYAIVKPVSWKIEKLSAKDDGTVLNWKFDAPAGSRGKFSFGILENRETNIIFDLKQSAGIEESKFVFSEGLDLRFYFVFYYFEILLIGIILITVVVFLLLVGARSPKIKGGKLEDEQNIDYDVRVSRKF